MVYFTHLRTAIFSKYVNQVKSRTVIKLKQEKQPRMQLIFVTVLASVLLPHYAIAQEALRDHAIGQRQALQAAIASFTSNPALGWTQLTSPVIANIPPAPDTDTPDNQRTPGGTRGGACKQTDKQTDKPLTALVPIKGSESLTTAEHPVFWFYVPDAPEEIHTIEFSVHDRDEKETLYRTSVQLTKTPGVVGIPLPPSPKHSLKLNESYHWRLIINCDANETSENMLELDGWVTRVQQSSNPWFDNLTNLAKRYLSEPQNPEVKTAWIELLKSVGLEGLAQAPLVSSSQEP